MAFKRKRPFSFKKRSLSKKGSGRYGFKRRRTTNLAVRALAGVSRLNSMIETKESCRTSGTNVSLPHNNIKLVLDSIGNPMNPLYLEQGTTDPMGANSGYRIGDKVSLKGLMIRGFFENAFGRAKVHFRVMLLRGAKGETFDRSTIYKGDAGNKIIDQVNTERFTIVAQKYFTIKNDTVATTASSTTGVPNAGYGLGQPTKTFKMWIPGRKFGRYGNLIYENGSASQVKFYDYRIVVMAYDWYGTPQDINDVGKINEMYTKMYFKDA